LIAVVIKIIIGYFLKKALLSIVERVPPSATEAGVLSFKNDCHVLYYL